MEDLIADKTSNKQQYGALTQAMDEAKELIPKIIAKNNKVGISRNTMEVMDEREQALIYFDNDRIKELNSEIQNSKNNDKHDDMVKSVDKDLDLRDRWLGIRGMKKQYQPMAYSQKDKEGKHIPMNRRAEFAAKYWADEIWNKNIRESIDQFLTENVHNN